MLGTFGFYSNPEIDRESDLLRELDRLRSEVETLQAIIAERDSMIDLLMEEITRWK